MVAFDEFEEIDAELTRAFAGMSAPPSLAAAVRRRVSVPAPTHWPELLDGIACISVVSFAACVAFFVILK